MKNSHPWVVVNHGGADHQEIVDEFPTYMEAYEYIRAASQYQEGPGGDHLDIMKRLRSGVLTTEY